jgi:hypothetical protein
MSDEVTLFVSKLIPTDPNRRRSRPSNKFLVTIVLIQ